MSNVSFTSNTFQNYMLSFSKQNDFTAQAAGFSGEIAHQNVLAKTKVANQKSVDSAIQKIADSVGSGDMSAAKENFNSFLASLDQSKLTSKAAKDIAKLREALNSEDTSDAAKALINVQTDSRQIYGAYDASKAYAYKYKIDTGVSDYA